MEEREGGKNTEMLIFILKMKMIAKLIHCWCSIAIPVIIRGKIVDLPFKGQHLGC